LRHQAWDIVSKGLPRRDENASAEVELDGFNQLPNEDPSKRYLTFNDVPRVDDLDDAREDGDLENQDNEQEEEYKEFKVRDFERDNMIGECVISVPSDELETLLLEHIAVQNFGADTPRNHPLNEADVEKITSDMLHNGIQSSLLTFTMIASEDTCATMQEIRQATSSNLFFNYANLLEACEKKTIIWRSDLLDGHHRREALMSCSHALSIHENISIRARWLKPGCNPADYRR
jgi:hypothetical protein